MATAALSLQVEIIDVVRWSLKNFGADPDEFVRTPAAGQSTFDFPAALRRFTRLVLADDDAQQIVMWHNKASVIATATATTTVGLASLLVTWPNSVRTSNDARADRKQGRLERAYVDLLTTVEREGGRGVVETHGHVAAEGESGTPIAG